MEVLRRTPILNTYEQLRCRLTQLTEALRTDCTGVIVYRLPVVADDADVEDFIPVDKQGRADRVSRALLLEAIASYTHFEREFRQKRSTVARLPGCILVRDDPTDTVTGINTLKDELKALIQQTYPGYVERSRACQQLFPGVHMHQVYRHLYVAPRSVTRLNFTWQRRCPADVWITPTEAIEMATTALEQEQQTCVGDKETERLQALRIALEQFSSLPTTTEFTEEDFAQGDPDIPYQLLHRTVVRPHPRVQLFESPSGSKAVSTHPANLPLLCVTGKQAPDIRDLRDYGAKHSKKRRDAKTGFELLSSALHIYGGVPTRAMYLRRLRLRQQQSKTAG